MADGELLDAREAMALLGINENELQTLVARGDLRAFRAAGTMKFRRDDILNIKTEKSTEPTIIVPAAPGGRRPSGANLPPAAPPKAAPRPTAKPAAPPQAAPTASGGQDNATGEILLDDFELVPTDDVANTQQVTVQQPAVMSGQTVVESTAGSETIVEGAVEAEGAGATRSAQPVTVSPSRRAQTAPAGAATSALPAAPAMSRVRAAVASGVHAPASKRTQALAVAKTFHPIITAVLLFTTVILIYTASICAVMMFRGSYDKDTGQRIIPPYLSEKSQMPVWQWCYKNTPGTTHDHRPSAEYPKVEEQ